MSEPSLQAHRAAAANTADRFPADPGVEITRVNLGGVPAERIVAGSASSVGTLLYLHPGGYVTGTPAHCRQFAGRLSAVADVTVLVPAYRLAPEHPFPAALNDAVQAYRAMLDDGADPAATVIGGASAGGGLAIAALLAGHAAGLPHPAAAFVISPWADLTLSGSTAAATESAAGFRSPSYLAEVVAAYLAGHDPSDPLASPVLADLTGLPPLHVEASAGERLFDDAARLARRARRAGIDATLHVIPGDLHCLPHNAIDSAEGRAALRRITTHIQGRLQGPALDPTKWRTTHQ